MEGLGDLVGAGVADGRVDWGQDAVGDPEGVRAEFLDKSWEGDDRTMLVIRWKPPR